MVASNSFTYQQKIIHYRISGSGPCVVLLHGFGETGAVWDQQLSFLAKYYSVLVPDLPGSGASEAIDDMSMEGLAACMAALIQDHTPEPHCLIGHSMGGYIALAYAEKFEDRLSGLGLFHSTAYADTPAKAESRKKAIELVSTKGPKPFLQVAVPGLFANSTAKKQPELIEKQIKDSHNFSASSIVSYYSAMMIRPDRCAVLTSFDKPILFILGNFDSLVPPEDLLAQARLAKYGYTYRLECSGHMGMLEEPEKTNQILTSYLARVFG